MSAEKFILACDACKHLRHFVTLLAARAEAERHGAKTGHDSRVYLSLTRQVGAYDGLKKEFELLPERMRP